MANGCIRAINETTELGIGILVAESENGAYEPVAPVSTIREATDMASGDLRRRMDSLENGSEPLCPARHRVWARDDRGEFTSVAEIEPN
jgi:hypothetical protein